MLNHKGNKIFIFIFLSMILFFSGGTHAWAQDTKQTPEQVTTGFYKWYLYWGASVYKENNGSEVKKYISNSLLGYLYTQMNPNGTMKEDGTKNYVDYFVKICDWDDRLDYLNVKEKEIDDGNSMVLLSIGAKGAQRKYDMKYSVILVKEGGSWKINSVKIISKLKTTCR